MNIVTKDATITNTDDEFPGSFQVILSTPTKDRDGEEVKSEEWQQPLPDHITFDVDHGMSVEKTIGSGVPSIDPATGNLVVDGTYSSLPRAQEVRTLVTEKHIRTTSVAFARHTTTDKKTGTKTVSRELLNGAFVAIPANPEAVVLASKAGARNSAGDQAAIQSAHDALTAVGAVCAGPMDDTGAEEGAVGGKSVDEVETEGTMFSDGVETKGANVGQQFESRIHQDFTNRADDMAAYGMLTREERISLSGAIGAGLGAFNAHLQENAPHLYERDPWTEPAAIAKSVRAAYAKALTLSSPDAATDVTRLAQAADAALDEAMNFLDGVDKTDMPETVAQAIDLSTAGWTAVRSLMEALHAYDPDGDNDSTDDNSTDEGGTSPDAKSDDAVALELRHRAIAAQASAMTA